jgi:hypothetical protein
MRITQYENTSEFIKTAAQLLLALAFPALRAQ